jgi:hypothetical protein
VSLRAGWRLTEGEAWRAVFFVFVCIFVFFKKKLQKPKQKKKPQALPRLAS